MVSLAWDLLRITSEFPLSNSGYDWIPHAKRTLLRKAFLKPVRSWGPKSQYSFRRPLAATEVRPGAAVFWLNSSPDPERPSRPRGEDQVPGVYLATAKALAG